MSNGKTYKVFGRLDSTIICPVFQLLALMQIVKLLQLHNVYPVAQKKKNCLKLQMGVNYTTLYAFLSQR
jgi:hypothetical protein